MNETEAFWNWFVGFWEGEGCVMVYKTKKYKPHWNPSNHSRLHVAQANRIPLDYIKDNIGYGRVHYNRPAKAHKFADKGNWAWMIDDRGQFIEIVEKMIPFARFRKQELEEALKKTKTIFNMSGAMNRWSEKERQLITEKKENVRELASLLPHRTKRAIETQVSRMRQELRKP